MGENQIFHILSRLRKKFVRTYTKLRSAHKRFYFNVFDPNSDKCPQKNDTLHINSVFVNKQGIFCGAQKNVDSFLLIKNNKLMNYAEANSGSHNLMPLQDKVIYNSTVMILLFILKKIVG